MLTFQRETLFDIIEEVDALLALHYQELTLNKDRVRLDPQWDVYRTLEQLGRFVVFTARDGNLLVGYNAFFVQKHMHYAGFTVAQNDVLFLHPDYRLGMTGIRLLKTSEAGLKVAGAEKITYHVKFLKDFRPILHRLGYSDEEVMCGKII